MNNPSNRDLNTPAFNMGIATLERINNILIAMSENNINNDIPKSKRILKELLKEGFGYMNIDEIKKAQALWNRIKEKPIEFEDSNTIKYDKDLIKLMDELDFLIRDCLFQSGLLMPNLAKIKGLSRLEHSYKLNDKTNNQNE
jgi:hypothetical protein